MKKVSLFFMLMCVALIHSIAQFSKVYEFTKQTDLSLYNLLTNDKVVFDGIWIYGIAQSGGSNAVGGIYKIKPNGTDFTKIFDFSGTSGSTLGANPTSLTLSHDTLYGVCRKGGSSDVGTVYRVKTNGLGFEVLHEFVQDNKGFTPYGPVTLLHDTLYGMTVECNTNGSQFGCIYKMNIDGTGYDTLMTFNKINGSRPYGGLTFYNGYFYGMTREGGKKVNGSSLNLGVIFKISPNGAYTKLVDLNGSTSTKLGNYPNGTLTLHNGYFYGVTTYGGVNSSGTVFRMSPEGVYEKIHEFKSNEAYYPFASLIFSEKDNLLYGTTENSFNGNGQGSIFCLDTAGQHYTRFFAFSNVNTGPDNYPQCTLTLIGDSVLVGTTSNHDGSLFSIRKDSTGFKKLIRFNAPFQGTDLTSTLIVVKNKLFGTAQYGGANNSGSLFSIDENDQFQKIYDYNTYALCGKPVGSLTFSGDTIFGQALERKGYTTGSLYRFEINGQHFDTLHNFITGTGVGAEALTVTGTNMYYSSNFLDGSDPSLTSGGALYTIKTNNTGFSSLFNFYKASPQNGNMPSGTLLQIGDTLYGATLYGGTSQKGNIFKIHVNGSGFTNIHNFLASEGNYPDCGLIADGDTLYGMTYSGGTSDLGTIFKINKRGSGYKKIFDFLGASTGSVPYSSGIIIYGDSIYGTTSAGGSLGFGVVFRIGKNGTGFKKLIEFNGTSTGKTPVGSLVVFNNALYGITQKGGKDNCGTIFKYAFPKRKAFISWAKPADIEYGTVLNSTQLNAYASASGTFTYTPDLGTKLNTGQDQILKVHFTPSNSSAFFSADTTVKINVTKATPQVTWNNPSDIIYGTLLSNVQLNASCNVQGNYTYSPSSGTKLGSGANQPLTVSFTPTDINNYNFASKTVYINVAKDPNFVKVDPIITWENPADITYGSLLSDIQLNAIANTSGYYTFLPPKGSKLNTGKSQVLKVTFIPADTDFYNTVNKQVVINVNKVFPEISWNKPNDIEIGTFLSSAQLNATCNVVGSLTYTPALGTKLNCGRNQKLQVDFIPSDTSNYYTSSISVNINVLKINPIISWNNPSDIIYGTLLNDNQLNASCDIAGTFVYSPKSGTKLNSGSNQKIQVEFIPSDTTNYNTANKSISINVLKINPVIFWNNSSDINYGTLLNDNQLNASCDIAGTLVYFPKYGTKLNSGPNQRMQVEFIPSDTTNYNTASKSVNINVLKINPVISWNNPSDINYGTLLNNNQLNASCDIAGTFAYSPKSGTKLNSGPNQKMQVEFIPSDTTNYNTASKSVNINVFKINPVISWNNPSDINYGTLLNENQLNASCDIAGTFAYSPKSGTKLNSGPNQKMQVEFIPSDTNNYNTASKSVSINVLKINPVISWNNPSDINYGTLLTNIQLNATADVPGTYSYNPKFGTKLNIGNKQELSVKFIPDDTVNYYSLNKTAFINVLLASGINILKADVSVYPNPMHNFFEIESRTAFTTISIIDLNGKVVFNQHSEMKMHEIIFIKNIDAGQYLLLLKDNCRNILTTKKIVKLND